MAHLMQLRLAAREIFNEALRAVDARAAVRAAIRLEEPSLNICSASFNLTPDQPIYAIAIGKAALAMALGFDDRIGERLSSGFIAGPIAGQPHGQEFSGFQAKFSTRWRWCEGEHPLPNKASLLAGETALALVARANQERASLIFLVSGGGSAMVEWPINDSITLANLRMANQALISSGAPINEINAVRRAFSAIKGGKLAEHGPDCQQLTLIISDVPKGREYDVASGPTLAPPADALAPVDVIERHGLRNQMPRSILQAIDDWTREPTPPAEHPYFVLLDTNSALDAAASAARHRGLTSEIAHEISDGPIERGVLDLLNRLSELRSHTDGNACLISGGEFSCAVRGAGLGGRSLETALRLAIAAEQRRQIGEFVALCAGTDGIDGNSPAAGAVIDNTTIERARRIGLDPNDFLERSDAYSFFVALGDAIATGPTGTNVRDLRILLASGQ